MEEDILQRVIQEIKTYGDLDGIEDIRPLGKALENLIARNKELEYTLKHTQNSWYEDTKIIENYKQNYISKDKIKEKIEEIEKFEVEHEMDFKAFYRIKDIKRIEIAVLQKLLQEGDK